MRLGIVGHEEAKFTVERKAKALAIIRELLRPPDAVLVSGRCPLGGIDVWAEAVADELGREKIIHAPEVNQWAPSGGRIGYKARNLLIARDSEECHCIVVAALPPEYRGMRFHSCYHCKTTEHVKSGGCWTTWRCAGRRIWHVV